MITKSTFKLELTNQIESKHDITITSIAEIHSQNIPVDDIIHVAALVKKIKYISSDEASDNKMKRVLTLMDASTKEYIEFHQTRKTGTNFTFIALNSVVVFICLKKCEDNNQFYLTGTSGTVQMKNSDFEEAKILEENRSKIQFVDATKSYHCFADALLKSSSLDTSDSNNHLFSKTKLKIVSFVNHKLYRESCPKSTCNHPVFNLRGKWYCYGCQINYDTFGFDFNLKIKVQIDGKIYPVLIKNDEILKMLRITKELLVGRILLGECSTILEKLININMNAIIKISKEKENPSDLYFTLVEIQKFWYDEEHAINEAGGDVLSTGTINLDDEWFAGIDVDEVIKGASFSAASLLPESSANVTLPSTEPAANIDSIEEIGPNNDLIVMQPIVSSARVTSSEEFDINEANDESDLMSGAVSKNRRNKNKPLVERKRNIKKKNCILVGNFISILKVTAF